MYSFVWENMNKRFRFTNDHTNIVIGLNSRLKIHKHEPWIGWKIGKTKIQFIDTFKKTKSSISLRTQINGKESLLAILSSSESSVILTLYSICISMPKWHFFLQDFFISLPNPIELRLIRIVLKRRF